MNLGKSTVDDSKRQDSEQKNVGRDATQVQIQQMTVNHNTFILAGDAFDETARKTVTHIQEATSTLIPGIYDKEKGDEILQDWESTEGIFTILKTKESALETVKELSFSAKERVALEKYQCVFEAFAAIARIEDKSDGYGTMLLGSIRILCREEIVDALPPQVEVADKVDEIAEQRTRLTAALGWDFQKVYNMLRSNDIEQAVMGKWVDECCEKGDEGVKEFATFWRTRLSKHPNKVWLTYDEDKEDVIGIMRDYLVMKKYTEMYAKGDKRIKVAKEAVEDLRVEFPEYVVNRSPGQICRIKTLTHIFLPKKLIE